jgi:indolepyruvate ferredoxin oxidoreductase beta subunit
LKDDGVIFTSTYELTSSTVNTGLQKDMPESKTAIIERSAKKVFAIDPTEHKSLDFDISKMMNIVMLGFYAEFRGYSHDDMLRIIKESVPKRFIEGNLKAYELGTTLSGADFAAE